MNQKDKIKLLNIGYNKAKEFLKDVKEHSYPMCGDIMETIELANKTIDNFKWLCEDSNSDIPRMIMEFIE